MRVAVLSDIHGNIRAFEAVLERLETLQVDEVYCLGDIVGYGPDPDECIDLVRARCALTVMGNHDAALCGRISLDHFDPAGRKALQKSAGLVRKSNLEFLSQLPLVVSAHGMTLAHASPHEPGSWAYIHSPIAAREAFGAFSTPLCFIGHTHVPIVIDENLRESNFRRDTRLLVNAGSVGQPRDGHPEAAAGILDTDHCTWELLRVGYDVGKTVEAIHRAHFPPVLAERLEGGF